MKAIVVPPLRVSPLIKLSRWVLLIAGIYHGYVKHKEYTIEVANFRIEEEKRKVLRAEQLAREEALKNQETARDLAEALTGLRIQFLKSFGSEDNDVTSAEETISTDDNTSVSKDISPNDENVSTNNSTSSEDGSQS